MAEKAIAPTGFCHLLQFPDFVTPVPAGGYRWWYVDAISNDGKNMLTLIIFIGSVFSPYYRKAYRRGRGIAHNHCSVNIALYGEASRWCMTERPQSSVMCSPDQFVVGPSTVRFQPPNGTHANTNPDPQGRLVFELKELTVPFPRRVKGTVQVSLPFITEKCYSLSEHHWWWPASPQASVEVNLTHPKLDWQGHAYVDTNWGNRPLELDIEDWCWARYRTNNATEIHYDVNTLFGDKTSVCIAVTDSGETQQLSPPALQPLPKTGWQLPQNARGDKGSIEIIQTLEDTPFYARSLLHTRLHNRPVTGIHEVVSMKRFKRPIVQAMLYCRMPRWSTDRAIDLTTKG